MSQLPVPEIIRSNRRTLSLQFLHDGRLIAKVPHRVSQAMIEKFIVENREWIEKHAQKMQHRPTYQKHEYKEGEIFLYVGKEVTLTIGNTKEIYVHGGKLHFPEHLVFRIKKELEQWYVSQAKQIITTQTERFAQEMKTSYKEITFSDTKSQWGRCTSDNRLQFSWRLVMAPLLTLNYVVIHELAHTMEKNHSRAFWSKVRQFTPSYRQQMKWLQMNGHALFV